MMTLALASRLRSVLCLGAHCDDVEIGCGGTLHALAQANPNIHFQLVVFSSDQVRGAETRAAMNRIFASPAQFQLKLSEYKDGFFPLNWGSIKEEFEVIKSKAAPDLVLTHYEHDRHQDHRIVSELTWNTFRNHLILEYEIPKYDGDLGRPAVYMPLSRETVDHKMVMLLDSFSSQRNKAWFADDLFRGLMRVRGMECSAPSGYAEAFYARKVVLEV